MSALCQKRASPHPITSSARYNVGGICGDSTGARVGFPQLTVRLAVSRALHSDVQPPQHVGDKFLHVLMAAVGEGDASALSVGRRRCSGDDSFRIDDDGLIVRLRELHECHERPCL